MKKAAIKWIIAACAVFFLIGGNAWADGKAGRGKMKGGNGGSYQAGPKHPGGHGQPGNHIRPTLGKQRPHEAHRGPYHRPQGYRPHYGPGQDRPNHGYGEHRPHYRPHPGYGHGRKIGIGVFHSSYLFSAILNPPAVAVGVIAGHR